MTQCKIISHQFGKATELKKVRSVAAAKKECEQLKVNACMQDKARCPKFVPYHLWVGKLNLPVFYYTKIK